MTLLYNLSDIIKLIWKNKKVIALSVAICLVISLPISYFSNFRSNYLYRKYMLESQEHAIGKSLLDVSAIMQKPCDFKYQYKSMVKPIIFGLILGICIAFIMDYRKCKNLIDVKKDDDK